MQYASKSPDITDVATPTKYKPCRNGFALTRQVVLRKVFYFKGYFSHLPKKADSGPKDRKWSPIYENS